MKRYKVTYIVTGRHDEIIEVDDEKTINEVLDMCYKNFPLIEEYNVEVENEETSVFMMKMRNDKE